MKIVVDRQACISAATCVLLAAKTFVLDEEGKSEVINRRGAEKTAEFSCAWSTSDQDAQEVIIDAALACPVKAIQIFEDDGTPIV